MHAHGWRKRAIARCSVRATIVSMNRFGKPDEIATAIAFLFSEDAGFITGPTLFIDGGASIDTAPV